MSASNTNINWQRKTLFERILRSFNITFHGEGNSSARVLNMAVFPQLKRWSHAGRIEGLETKKLRLEDIGKEAILGLELWLLVSLARSIVITWT